MTPFEAANQKAAIIPLMYTREAKKRVASDVLKDLVAALKLQGKK